MRPLKRLVAAVLTVLLLVQATGCTSYQGTEQPWPTAVVEHPNAEVQVTLLDGRTIEADYARVRGEALVAYHGVETVDTIPLAQIAVVKLRQSDLALTILLALGIGALAFGAAVAVWAACAYRC